MARLPRRRTGWRVALTPVLIALASAIGLIAALLGEGVWDWIAWIALAVPVLALLQRPRD